MSENKISLALERLFDKFRIVFWCDAKQELRADFDALQIPGIEKLEIANNEFSVKYRILRQQPEQKFLLYREGPSPADLDNWLLDVQLAHGEFRTDQIGIWLSELELNLDFSDVVKAHAEFFQAAKRKDALKRLLKADDTPGLIRLKMLAVCASAEPRLDAVVENLLDELSAKNAKEHEKFKLLERCKLDVFLWEQMLRLYGYQSDEPSMRDFVITLFKDCYFQNFASGPNHSQNESVGDFRVFRGQELTGDALVFLKRWKDSRQFEECFETLSGECAENLGIEQDLAKRDFRELIELDYFRLIDQKIISDLVHSIAARTISSGDVTLWVRQRRQSHWYREFSHLYDAIDNAAQFIHLLDTANLTMDTISDGVERYCRFWFRLDQLYRKFVYHVRCSAQASLMGELAGQIENLYANNFLLKLNDRWQSCVDTAEKWLVPSSLLQKDFFKNKVATLAQNGKVCVIISDALRYEIGEELARNIKNANKYDAELSHALSMLPSYTQLGMAALLPNQQIALADNDSGCALVDGQNSAGLANRIKILQQSVANATAVKYEDILKYNREQLRSLCRDNQVIYVYHNHIDATGDDPKTEDRVFDAAEHTIQEITRIVTKIGGENYIANFLVTSDHGFIYQDRAIEDSDYLSTDATGNTILYRDRRFVLGKGLKGNSSFKSFSSPALGLAGDVEVLIPKSINRLRLKGSGSRFVHGGASLQEVVIPVIHINKKRQSDISAVDVEILRSTSTVITSGQLAVVLYQAQPVTDKVQARSLRAGIYMLNGELISDCHELTFDLSSENPRERELQVRFVLSRKADEANGQEVILRLDEKLAGTSHYKEYKALRYTMRRSFTSDFDF